MAHRYNSVMLAVAALVALSTPTFEELSKQSFDPFEIAKKGTVEYRIRFGAPSESTTMGLTFRLSKGPKGSVFEGLRDGHKVMRVMNDGKTVSVQATGAGVQCRLPANPKRPIDLTLFRLRPEGKNLRVVMLGDVKQDQFEGYVWKNTIDRADVMDGVDCRHLGYLGKREGEVDMTVECWLEKKTSALKFMRYKFGDQGSITVATFSSPIPLPLPRGPLAKVAFKGYESVPLSLVREKVAASWRPFGSGESAE